MNEEYENFLSLYELYKRQLDNITEKMIREKIELEVSKFDICKFKETEHIVTIKNTFSEKCYTKIFLFTNYNVFAIFSIRENEITLESGEVKESLLNWLKKYYNDEIFKEKLESNIEININNKIELLDKTFCKLFMNLLRQKNEPNTDEIIEFAKKEEWLGDTIEIRREYKRLTINCYKVASEMGSSEADLLLARKYYSIYTTRELAFPYYEKAVERNNLDAIIEVARYYKTRDEEKFLKYINLGIKLQSQEAKFILKDFNNQKECDMIAKDILKELQQKTAKRCYEIILEDNDSEILDSKIGGNPYIPINESYPISKDGKPMALLIQINFDRIKLDNYPSNGIFQVYSNQDFYKNEFIIKYYKNIEQNYQNEFPDLNLDNFILKKSFKIELKEANTFMPTSDKDFNNILKEIMKNHKRKSGVKDSLFAIAYPYPALLGGYADFTQRDVRKNKKYAEYTECLIKIDDQISKKLEIGDSGIINVLIKPEDLIDKNLENSVVVWDCM